MKRILRFIFFAGLVGQILAQDNVDVTFRYNAPSSPTVFLVGEFNGWNNSATPMDYIGSNTWSKTYRLAIGGNPSPPPEGVPGAWQYKFYYSGVLDWPNDPLNHHQNAGDNNNTYLRTNDPTIYHLLPNQRNPIVSTSQPNITAFIFPKVGASVDTGSISLKIDGTTYSNVGLHFDTSTHQLNFQAPNPLNNGNHVVILSAQSSLGGSNSDTVNFTIKSGFIQITTQGGFSTYNQARLVRGLVQDTSIHTVKVVRNNTDTTIAAISNGRFAFSDTLSEGLNVFKAVIDSIGKKVTSESVSYTYIVNHNPFAKASIISSTSDQLTLSASESIHPDNGTMTFHWIDDPANPIGMNGQTGTQISISKPTVTGEYYFTLVATDSIGASDTTRSYFIIKKNGGYENPSYASNPAWVKQARVYFLFPKSFTQEGTIPAATNQLQYVANLGFNVIWVMPVMKNAYPINQNYGPGYNIVDFYNVAPEYGTNQDFKNFVTQAHSLGLKIILDVTPNHTSRFHPWSQDAHLFKQDSRFWNWYEHTTISHNTNGLGQSFDADGFNYYSGFSDQLLNYNWTDVDARTEMINVYKYWIKEFGIDGYRFDVYWGPHRRYGEQYMGQRMREALKHIKPDIFLLAEDDGTGSGTETIYADYVNGDIRGGVDAAYDFKAYFNQIRNFGFSSTAVNNLHSELNNGGYFPGPNSMYMRFMESQDEDCITYFYSNSNSLDATTTFNRTKPMATVIFSSPGFPMIWNGQEVGWGYGISGSKEARNRSTISWDFAGKEILTSHYQRLAWIRGMFPAFSTQIFQRINTNQSLVYGILRPLENENAVALSNFGSSDVSISLDFTVTGSSPNISISNPQNGKVYYVNDVYNDSTYEIIFSGGAATFSMNIPAYGSSVLIISDSVKKISLPQLTSVHEDAIKTLPTEYSLSQNYPNPFNPSTTIRYSISQSSFVSLKIYDVLGREVQKLVNEVKTDGNYVVSFNASSLSSGIYFYKVTAGRYSAIKKMVLLK